MGDHLRRLTLIQLEVRLAGLTDDFHATGDEAYARQAEEVEQEINRRKEKRHG